MPGTPSHEPQGLGTMGLYCVPSGVGIREYLRRLVCPPTVPPTMLGHPLHPRREVTAVLQAGSDTEAPPLTSVEHPAIMSLQCGPLAQVGRAPAF